jgi:hypothetical protein
MCRALPNLRFTVSPPPPRVHIVSSQGVRQLAERGIYISHSMDVSRLHPLLIFVKTTSFAGISPASESAPRGASSLITPTGPNRYIQQYTRVPRVDPLPLAYKRLG